MQSRDDVIMAPSSCLKERDERGVISDSRHKAIHGHFHLCQTILLSLELERFGPLREIELPPSSDFLSFKVFLNEMGFTPFVCADVVAAEQFKKKTFVAKLSPAMFQPHHQNVDCNQHKITLSLSGKLVFLMFSYTCKCGAHSQDHATTKSGALIG